MGKQWLKSSSGPDWTDIRSMIVELGILHKCSCYLEIMPSTTKFGPQVRIICTAVSNTPGSDLKACEESVAMSWPNVSNATFEGTVYSALIGLDNRLLAKWWQQEIYMLP